METEKKAPLTREKSLAIPVSAHFFRQCFDIVRMVKVMSNPHYLALPTRLLQHGVHGVVDGRRRLRSFLRKKRQHHKAFKPSFESFRQHVRHTLRSVTHRPANAKTFAQNASKGLRRLFRRDDQGRTFGRPNRPIALRRRFTALGENHAVQNRPPKNLRHLDHAPVTQKFCQVGFKRRRGRFRRRSRVHEQYERVGSGSHRRCLL